MNKGLSVNANYSFMLVCKHCSNEYDLIAAKRNAKRSEPIRCPSCGCIVAT